MAWETRLPSHIPRLRPEPVSRGSTTARRAHCVPAWVCPVCRATPLRSPARSDAKSGSRKRRRAPRVPSRAKSVVRTPVVCTPLPGTGPVMPSLQPIGGAIRLNMNPGGAATTVPLADGGFAVVYRVANGPDVFRLFDANFQPVSGEIEVTTDDFLAPQATALNDGRFMVSWLAQDQTIQASIYNSDG